MDHLAFDGSWVDMYTLAMAVAYTAVRRLVCGEITTEAVMIDLSHGVTLFPMLLLSATVFSSAALDTLVHGNKLVISLAGFFSLLSLLKRTFQRPHRPPGIISFR